MTMLLQATARLEQPRVPPLFDTPPLAGWPREQPISLPKPPGSISVRDHNSWQRLDPEVLDRYATTGFEDAYVIEGRHAVYAFIEKHRLRGLLLQAIEPLKRAFGEGAIRTLTIVRDDEGRQTLFCLVMVPGDMQGAARALRCFDELWWLGRPNQACERLNFDFELV